MHQFVRFTYRKKVNLYCMLTENVCFKNQSVKLVRSKDNIGYNVGDLKRFYNAVTFPAINYKASF